MSVAQISHYTILVEHACDTRCVYFGSDGTKNASMACIVGRQLPTSKLRSIAIQSSSATMNVATDEISSAPCIDSVGNVNKSDIRIWMDGAFDMMHYGHMNAFRQAKALGKSSFLFAFTSC